MFALGLCTLTSCGDGEFEYIDNSQINSSMSVTINGTQLSYKINGTKFSIDETFRIELSCQSTNNNSALALYWDNVDVEHITEFPYTYEKKLEEVGTHNLKLKVGQILKDGSISFERDFSVDFDITVNR